MGYDGYGVKVIDNNNSIEDIPDKHCIIEDKAEIKKELSVMVVSRPSGELVNYPVVEMEFNNIILDEGYESLFNFSNIKEFVKLITSEDN